MLLHSSEADISVELGDYACNSPLVRILVQKDSQPGSILQRYVSCTPFLSAVALLEVSSFLLQSHNCLLNNAYRMCRHETGTCKSCAKGTQHKDHDCSNAPAAWSMCELPRLVLVEFLKDIAGEH